MLDSIVVEQNHLLRHDVNSYTLSYSCCSRGRFCEHLLICDAAAVSLLLSLIVYPLFLLISFSF